jgi:hypothetical protein
MYSERMEIFPEATRCLKLKRIENNLKSGTHSRGRVGNS